MTALRWIAAVIAFGACIPIGAGAARGLLDGYPGYDPGPGADAPLYGYGRTGFAPQHGLVPGYGYGLGYGYGPGYGHWHRLGYWPGFAREADPAAETPLRLGRSFEPFESRREPRAARGISAGADAIAHEAFAGMDTDGDGRLDEAEYLRGGLMPSTSARLGDAPQMRERFRGLDRDRDGHLSRTEFFAGGVRPR